nr:hypothetical protein [Ferrithrix thermotolerans]
MAKANPKPISAIPARRYQVDSPPGRMERKFTTIRRAPNNSGANISHRYHLGLFRADFGLGGVYLPAVGLFDLSFFFVSFDINP